jgi:hypothetical protein
MHELFNPEASGQNERSEQANQMPMLQKRDCNQILKASGDSDQSLHQFLNFNF